MKVSNSKLKTFNRCRRMYSYKFDRNLVPKTGPLPMKRGSWIHELLEAHYKGESWRDKLKELSTEFYKMFEEEREHYGDLPGDVAKIMKSYVYNWREEDSQMKVLATEFEIEVALPHGHTLVGRADLIAEDEYGTWLWEHKSHAKTPTSDYRFIDVQTSLYVWALNKMGNFGEINGVCWNYLITKPPTKPQLKQNGELSARKINTDLLTFVTALKEYGLDPRDYRDTINVLKKENQFFRRERVPKAKKVVEQLVREAIGTADLIEGGYYPIRSIDRSCEFQCSYKDLCITELYGGDAAFIEKAKYRVREAGEYYAGDENIEELV